jgi:hypothetical protein
MPDLVHELDIHADLAVTDVGAGPFGQRLNFTVVGGELVGDRIKGTFDGAGGDWLLLGPDGVGRLDVRFTVRTGDGAHIYVQYFGILKLTPEIQAILGGGSTPTGYGDQYFFMTPRLETGDERYSWVNETVFVGEGRVLPGPAVEYRVYRVANS